MRDHIICGITRSTKKNALIELLNELENDY